jgi:hypothetical protein
MLAAAASRIVIIAVITPIRYKVFGFKAEGRGHKAEARRQGTRQN